MNKDINGSRKDSKVAVSAPFMWISETHTPNDVYYHGVNRVIHSERTQYQQMVIADVGAYGRALFLDGCLQTSEGDEAFYHEAIVHAPSVARGSPPTSVLVLGGGDGGTAREVLRWKSVTSVVNVEIDRAVVDACRQHLPALSAGAFDDPRVHLVFDDAKRYLQDCSQRFDVIVCDLTDPIEYGPSAALFTLDFFHLLREHLTPTGAISFQSGTLSLPENDVNIARIYHTLQQVFDSVHIMQIFAPKYGTPLALSLATVQPLSLPSAEDVDISFRNNLHGENHVLDGRAFHALFAIPKCVSDILRRDRPIITDQDQIKLSGHGIMQ